MPLLAAICYFFFLASYLLACACGGRSSFTEASIVPYSLFFYLPSSLSELADEKIVIRMDLGSRISCIVRVVHHLEVVIINPVSLSNQANARLKSRLDDGLSRKFR
eukprot:scaffold28979_cov81-Skeletonema_dohrnii-CCMP3373.AAC.1